MLNFKVGKVYKDIDGKEWEFVSYAPGGYYPYFFKEKETNAVYGFCEQEGNIVTESLDAGGTKIPFVAVEEKESEWTIGESYECYDVHFEKITKAKLAHVENHKNTLIYRFELGKKRMFFCGTGEILSIDGYVIFKNGIPEELKDRINKGKLTNKRKCFQKGQIYKNEEGFEWEFKKRIKTKKGLVAVFENEEGIAYTYSIYRLNNIECTLCTNNKIHFCADESIRNKNAGKAVRVKK